MAANDAAFMWETEALRSSGAPAPPGYPEHGEREEGWLTLRETEAATGIPISTLRKWVRKEAVPSFIDETSNGPIRMLWLQGVEQRAEVLGRNATEPPVAKVEIDIEEEGSRQEPPTAVFADPDDVTTSSASVPPSEPLPSPRVSEPEKETITSEPPPGTMVVPIEAWDKMLLQLGNLHEAGQQLAEARERAGKAETEAKFLRERLSELRTQAQGQPVVTQPAPQPTTPEHQPHKRVSIEIEDGEAELEQEDIVPVQQPIVEEVASDEADETPLSAYSAAVVKHLWGTWRDRPRR